MLMFLNKNALKPYFIFLKSYFQLFKPQQYRKIAERDHYVILENLHAQTRKMAPSFQNLLR